MRIIEFVDMLLTLILETPKKKIQTITRTKITLKNKSEYWSNVPITIVRIIPTNRANENKKRIRPKRPKRDWIDFLTDILLFTASIFLLKTSY